MQQRLTDEQLQEIEARVNAATPGRWQTRFIYRSLQSTRRHAAEDHLMLGPDNDWNDADLTANAPTDLRALLAEIKALKRERDEARRELRTACDHIDGLLGELSLLDKESNDEYIAAYDYLKLLIDRGDIKVVP